MTIFLYLCVSVLMNLALFIPAFLFKTDKLTDISYAVSFLVLTGIALWQNTVSVPALIVAGMVGVWALRLGSYLFYRIHKMGRDTRFDEMRSKFFAFFKFWVLQGVSVWVVMLAALLMLSVEPMAFSAYSVLGLIVWGVGLLVESVADLQKFRFMQDAKNKGQWIDQGVWRYSRHPNYFGEICVWLGVFLFALPYLSGVQIIFAAVSPVYIALLLIFVSGIPLLEKAADTRWGNDPNYQQYKKETSVLIPLPRKGA